MKCVNDSCDRKATVAYNFENKTLNFCEFHAGIYFTMIDDGARFSLSFSDHSSDLIDAYEKAGLAE